jgi:hypothetical protein
MWKFFHWMFSKIAASQRVIDTRLTRAGMLVGGVVIASATLGADTNQTVSYRIFGFAVALLLVAAAGAYLQRGRYTVVRRLPRVATAGQPFQYRVTVGNLENAPRDGLALIDELADPRPALAEFRARYKVPTYRAWKQMIRNKNACEIKEMTLPEIAPHSSVEVTVAGFAQHRGNQHFRGATVARADPLGLVRGLSRHDERAAPSARRRRARHRRGRLRGIRRPARLPARRSAATHPLEKLRAHRRAGGARISG